MPGDLAVIGVDDLPVAALTRPGLTTIAIDAEVPAIEVARRILVEAGCPRRPVPADRRCASSSARRPERPPVVAIRRARRRDRPHTGPMDISASDPVGATVTGIDARSADPAVLVRLLGEHGVLILPGQDLDDAAFAAFLRGFGPPMFTAGETPVAGFPDLNVVSNVGRTTPPRSSFHVDTSYVARPPAYTALRAVAVPEQGGATQFTNQYRAHDTLPAAVRERVAGRTIRHVVTGVGPEDAGTETEAEHPVLRRHPVTGRAALYLTTPARCAAISGMDEQESRETVEYLFAHSTRDDNVLRHDWSPADLVIWDNACVLHRADHTGVVGDRVMHRGMVEGAEPVAA